MNNYITMDSDSGGASFALIYPTVSPATGSSISISTSSKKRTRIEENEKEEHEHAKKRTKIDMVNIQS